MKQKTVLCTLLVLALAASLFLGRSLRVVAEVEGSRLYYDGCVYEEIFINQPGGLGKRLGRAVLDGQKLWLYTVEDSPEILHLSLGWDGRLFQKQ